ncbi:MAG: VWA domain-containing protein [Deltaproteobacteria bacterium]|nr:VWA domain-containing protein [Deltaproteobacteria bacterium]
MDSVLADFITVCRRSGLPASPVQSIDLRRAAIAVGLDNRGPAKAAFRAVLVSDPKHVPIFDRAFDAFFRVAPGAGLGIAARAGGHLEEGELEALLAAITAANRAREGAVTDALVAVASGGAALDRALRDASADAGISTMRGLMQTGYFTQRTLGALRADTMRAALPEIADDLADTLGRERAAVLVALLKGELDGLRPAARALVDAEFARRNAHLREAFRRRMLAEKRFTALGPNEVEAVEREVRRLGERLRGRMSVRRKRRRRGRLDVRRTLSAAYGTGGVPFRPVFVRKPNDRPRLTVICDISDSVRFAARFLLMLTWALQDVFTRTRTFAFVSDLGETTALFEQHPAERALELVYGGAAVSVASGSDYGQALGVFTSRYADAIDQRTTVVIVGDGRTNYLDPNAKAFRQMATRAARVLWLNPEPRPSWGFGDSAMDRYLPHVDEALSVQNLETLRVAVDRILADVD